MQTTPTAAPYEPEEHLDVARKLLRAAVGLLTREQLTVELQAALQDPSTPCQRICVHCAQPFGLSKRHRAWYRERGYELPVRCPTCRSGRRGVSLKAFRNKVQRARERLVCA